MNLYFVVKIFISSFILLTVSLVMVPLVDGAEGRNDKIVAVLKGGLEKKNSLGDVIGYYITAKENVVVTPHLMFAINNSGKEMAVYQQAPISLPIGWSRVDSVMSWEMASGPQGGKVRGSHTVMAEPNNMFHLRDLIFEVHGEYKLDFKCVLFTGEVVKFSYIFTVQYQPSLVTIIEVPAGQNGSSLNPFPVIQLTDLLNTPIHIASVKVSFLIDSHPPKGHNEGDTSYITDQYGKASLDNIVLSEPGLYSYRIVANLPDGKQIYSAKHTVNIERARPVRIEFVHVPAGMAGFVLHKQPLLSVYDEKGMVNDNMSAITLHIDSQNSALLTGKKTAFPENYQYAFTDITINMPGKFELIAYLSIKGIVVLKASTFVNVDPAPTYLIASKKIQKYDIVDIAIYGNRPKYSRMHFMISGDPGCSVFNSPVVPYPADKPGAKVRKIHIAPHIHGQIHLCMTTEKQTNPTYVLLAQLHTGSLKAVPFALKTTFRAQDVPICKPTNEIEEALFRRGKSDDIEANRRYGCMLTRPVGTKGPCNCPSTLTCVSYMKDNLDIGQCVCCAPSMMGVVGALCAVGFSVVIYIIYQFV
eukprot:Tbor_TRINITY_DN4039_c0_g1::TRINITY_DN4039_c0_g1_i1::g.11702::m.11702